MAATTLAAAGLCYRLAQCPGHDRDAHKDADIVLYYAFAGLVQFAALSEALPATARQRKTVVVISEHATLPAVVLPAPGGAAVSPGQRAFERAVRASM